MFSCYVLLVCRLLGFSYSVCIKLQSHDYNKCRHYYHNYRNYYFTIVISIHIKEMEAESHQLQQMTTQILHSLNRGKWISSVLLLLQLEVGCGCINIVDLEIMQIGSPLQLLFVISLLLVLSCLYVVPPQLNGSSYRLRIGWEYQWAGVVTIFRCKSMAVVK